MKHIGVCHYNMVKMKKVSTSGSALINNLSVIRLTWVGTGGAGCGYCVSRTSFLAARCHYAVVCPADHPAVGGGCIVGWGERHPSCWR